jgi:hypothetical protein
MVEFFNITFYNFSTSYGVNSNVDDGNVVNDE